MSIWWQKTLACPLCLRYCPFGLAGIKWLISYFPILVWHGITQYWCNKKSWKLDSYWSYDHYWNMVTWFSYVHFFFFSNSSGCQLRTMQPNLLTKNKSSSIMLPKYAYQSQKRTMLVFLHWLQLQALAKQATLLQ